VQIRITGAEKQRYTVMLAITADRQKLPPYVIFKCKAMAKKKFRQGIIVRVSESGWMTEDLVDDWIKSVWLGRPGTLLCQRSMLVLTAYRARSQKM
jgi:hypothetical protein